MLNGEKPKGECIACILYPVLCLCAVELQCDDNNVIIAHISSAECVDANKADVK